MKLTGGGMFAKAIERARLLAKQTFATALLTDKLVEQKRCLDEKKALLVEGHGALSSSITETMLDTAAVIATLRNGVERFDVALNAIASTTSNQQGVMFINYRGEVIFTNAFTHQLLGIHDCDLATKTIESFIVGEKPRKHIIENYSLKIINYIKAHPADQELPVELLGCKMINDAFIGPVFAKFGNCGVDCGKKICTKAFTFEASLLDTHPSVIEDITYICKLSPFTCKKEAGTSVISCDRLKNKES